MSIKKYADKLLNNDSYYDERYEYCLALWGNNLLDQILEKEDVFSLTPILKFHYDNDSDGVCIFQGENGMILTSEQIDLDKLVSYLYKFHDYYSDKEICDMNYKNMTEQRINKDTKLVKSEKHVIYNYVYLIYSTSGHYKIGISNNPVKRMRQLIHTIPPFDLSLIKQVKTKYPVEVETYLHNILKKYNVRGEWFVFDDTTLKMVLSELDRLEKEMNYE